MIGSFPDKRFDRFGPIYYPPHQKQMMNKNDIPVPVDASKISPIISIIVIILIIDVM